MAVARRVKMGRKLKLSMQQVAHARKLIEQGGIPQHGGAISQRLAADAVSGAVRPMVTALYRAGPAYGIRSNLLGRRSLFSLRYTTDFEPLGVLQAMKSVIMKNQVVTPTANRTPRKS